MRGRLSALLLLLAALALPAQEVGTAAGAGGSTGATAGVASGASGSEFGRPRYMIYLFEAEQGTFTPQQSFLLYNSVLAAVAQANKDVVILESPDPAVPWTSEGKEELARRVNADCWLHVSASGGFDNLTVEASTFDILRQETTSEETIHPGFAVDSRSIARGFWDNVAGAIRGDYSRVIDLTTLTVKGQPGTELAGIPGGPYRIDSSGVLVQKVPYPSVFTLRARAGGFYDIERPMALGIDPTEVVLDQVRKPWIGVEASLSSLQFPMVRAWISVIPAQVFVRVGICTHMIGLYPIDNASALLVTGSPLSFLTLDAGLYVLPPESLFRLFAAAGGYLRISHPAGYFGLDQEGAPGAATLALGAEYSPSRRVRLVVTYEPAFIFASDPQEFISISFVPNTYPSGNVPGYVKLPWGIVDFRNVYLGVRVDF
ncbi:MAG TPA: hypothetical protein VFI08_07345 [Spirochaetia bacterium]|nr:hypothetical protein [Spirochaetia bacterium]